MAPTNPPRQTTPEPDAVSDVASDVASRGSRTEIMPHYDDKGIVDSPWEIRIILIPSARDTTPPMKGTNAYLRLKSRNLILNTIIPGRDHTSFFTTVQSQLRDALQGREWIPLATYYEQATGATRLAPLPPALVDHGYTYQFLAQNCLVQHPSKPKVTIYIALRHTTLSWDQIRHLPRARPRISGLRSLPPERWWDLDDQLDLEELATHSTYALVLRPKPAAPTANDVSQTSAADSKSRSVSSCPKPAPAQGPGTAKNKHPCPYFDCPRNRLPFKQECFLFEHLEGKHKDTAWRTEVPADDGSSSTVDPLVSGVDQDTTSKTPLPDNSGDTNVASSSKPHATITPPSSVDLAASTESLQESCQLQPGDTEHSSGRDNSAEGSSYSADSGHGASSSTEGYDRTQPKRRRTSNQSGGGGNGSGDGEDDENDGGEENGAQSHTGKQQGPGKRFACPFFKHDPVKYGSDSSCRGKGWPSSHRVKHV
ncbi:hypothetical protein B0T14DRAFT_312235 [Immersiella caudata]|uniref:C2H2-type domain-containing protein n=1 Tax=Immersiella caudata TaxID=314043 RepID=A0AA39WFW7_9PEZI|nr:hypothetical protein B0T14DRAFT_312235 [Immersiella caudata]